MSEMPPGRKPPWSKGDFAVAAAVTTIPVLVLLVAMLPGHPYGYFIFLRWVVCAAAIVFVAMFHRHELTPWMYGFGFVAILYNPILRVHLTREIWILLNIATIVAFVAGFVALVINQRHIARQLRG